MAMTAEERAAHCRRIGALGGRALVAARGREYMARIGRVGFQAAIDLGYGKYLADVVLRASYRAKFGTDPHIKRNADGDKARAKARKDKPELGPCAWPDGCSHRAEERHHVDGWKASDETIGLCSAHHDELERAYRAARKIYRPHTQDPVTKRAVAISIGIGLDDGVPF